MNVFFVLSRNIPISAHCEIRGNLWNDRLFGQLVIGFSQMDVSGLSLGSIPMDTFQSVLGSSQDRTFSSTWSFEEISPPGALLAQVPG